MKKFMALKIRAIVDTIRRDSLIIVIISNHFTKKLAMGGMPARFAIIINSTHFFVLVLDSVFKVFILKFFRVCIIINTEDQ